MSEEENSLLITAQIPFLGYIISPRHSDIALMRDVSQLNLVTTLSATIFFLTGHSSFASLVMLVYTIWCVAQSLRLTFHGEITTLDMSRVPTPTEKYLMLRA